MDKIYSDVATPAKPPIQLQAGEDQISPNINQQSNKPDIFSYTYFDNGQEVMSGSKRRGLGKLTLVNGSQKDAVALLFREDADTVARSVFIAAGRSANIDNIAVGKYLVRITVGKNWSDDKRCFAEDDEYFTFPHAYGFSEEKIGNQTQFDEVSLTLNALPNGNIQKEPITKAQFLAIRPAN